MESLRTEVIESEKLRADLLRWKLILVAAIGGVGLGLSETDVDNTILPMPLLICLIPFVCVYVDLLARHLNLRILAIGEFLYRASVDRDDMEAMLTKEYERFCNEVRSIFELETWALKGSSIFLSILVMLLGLLVTDLETLRSVFVVSGLLGIVAAWTIDELYKKKVRSLKGTSQQLFEGDVKGAIVG